MSRRKRTVTIEVEEGTPLSGIGCALLIGICSVGVFMGPMGLIGLVGGALAIGICLLMDLCTKGHI